MQSAPIPENEKERMDKILSLGILDTQQEERFDAITREATEEFNVPISTITIIDTDREWYKSCHGSSATEAPRAQSFCAHAMHSQTLFVVEDTLKDDRFKDNPMVVGKPYIRFYAGCTLWSKDGLSIGVFCIKDTKPRVLSTDEVGKLIEFAGRAEKEINKK